MNDNIWALENPVTWWPQEGPGVKGDDVGWVRGPAGTASALFFLPPHRHRLCPGQAADQRLPRHQEGPRGARTVSSVMTPSRTALKKFELSRLRALET